MKLGTLYVGDSCVAWSLCEAPGSVFRIFPSYMSCLFAVYSQWWDALLSLDVGGRDLVLSQLGVSDFIFDSLNSFWEVYGGWRGMGVGDEEGDQWFVCKVNTKFEIKVRKKIWMYGLEVTCINHLLAGCYVKQCWKKFPAMITVNTRKNDFFITCLIFWNISMQYCTFHKEGSTVKNNFILGEFCRVCN